MDKLIKLLGHVGGLDGLRKMVSQAESASPILEKLDGAREIEDLEVLLEAHSLAGLKKQMVLANSVVAAAAGTELPGIFLEKTLEDSGLYREFIHSFGTREGLAAAINVLKTLLVDFNGLEGVRTKIQDNEMFQEMAEALGGREVCFSLVFFVF